MTARDLAEQMAALADLLGLPRDTPWPELTAKAIELIQQLKAIEQGETTSD